METLGHRLTSVDDEHHVWGEHERNAISAEPGKLLSVSKELAKVDVEEVAGGLDHDVVVVTISDAHDVGDDAVASTRSREVLDSRLKLKRALVVLLQPSIEDPCLKSPGDSSSQGLNLSKSFRILNKLNNPSFPTGGNTLKGKSFDISKRFQLGKQP